MGFERALAAGVCLMAVLLGACGFSAEGGETVRDTAIAAPDMDTYWAAHVAHRQSGDLVAATSILAEDCVLFEPFQPPVSGRQAIAAKMKAGRELAETHELLIDSNDVYRHDGRLVDFGVFSETFSFQGEEDRYVVEGNYAAFLERDLDGEWKVQRFMALPTTPPPSPSGAR